MSLKKLSLQEFNDGLLAFLNASPTPFHAVATMAARLNEAGFTLLDERQDWDCQPAGKHYVVRDGSIIAFTVGEQPLANEGWRLFGAHTDSPCLKVKPRPELLKQGVAQLGVEVYGGALLNPWFDRDLSLAGRVYIQSTTGELTSQLVDFSRSVATIPSLAIHLDREANNERKVNPQTDLPPAVLLGEEKSDLRQLLAVELGLSAGDQVLDYELCFYDRQAAAICGLKGDFISGARLDNLLSCYIGLQALLTSDSQGHAVLVCTDHEEVGSKSATGADGPFLSRVLERLAPDRVAFSKALVQSWLVSADNAHAIHPNFADRHDGNHGPKLNAGPVIKLNANQRYATSDETAARFRQLAAAENVPLQDFVVRTDLGCGSTIGPITAGRLGVKTIDVGVPQWAMHSIRETAGSLDSEMLYRITRRFFAGS